MRKASIEALGELSKSLSEFGQLVRELETRDPSFFANMMAWSRSSEEALVRFGFVEATKLAALRSQVLSTGEDRMRSTRKAMEREAAAVLHDSHTVVLNAYITEDTSIKQARELTRQLILIAIQSDSVSYDVGGSFQDFITRLWRWTTANPQLKTGVAKLRMSLKDGDILVILADEVDVRDFAPAEG